MSDPGPTTSKPHRRPGLRRRLTRIVLLGLGAYVLIITGCQRAVIFPRSFLPDASNRKPPPYVERLARSVKGGEVEAWLARGEGEGPRPIVIFAHGNAELIDDWPPLLRPYVERGVSVLLIEFRGYGRSAGKPSQKAIVDDYIYFDDLVKQRDDVDAQHVIIHGRSLGGGIAAQLAQQRPPAALVLESSFTSVADMARSFGVPRFLVFDKLDVRRVIEHATYPVLILHSRDDDVIPVKHAERNHAACPSSTLVLFDGPGHNDPLPSEPYWRAIDALLVEAGTMPPNDSHKDTPP